MTKVDRSDPKYPGVEYFLTVTKLSDLQLFNLYTIFTNGYKCTTIAPLNIDKLFNSLSILYFIFSCDLRILLLYTFLIAQFLTCHAMKFMNVYVRWQPTIVSPNNLSLRLCYKNDKRLSFLCCYFALFVSKPYQSRCFYSQNPSNAVFARIRNSNKLITVTPTR